MVIYRTQWQVSCRQFSFLIIMGQLFAGPSTSQSSQEAQGTGVPQSHFDGDEQAFISQLTSAIMQLK